MEEQKQEAASTSETEKKEAEKEDSPNISFEEFMAVDLRVAQIMEAERIEKSDKLIKLQISLGPELGMRQIVAGIAKHYQPEALVGRKIVVVANLKPAKLMGEKSEGMLLAASDEESNLLELLSPGNSMPAGARVR